MRIAGEWLLCDDAVSRPIVRAQVVGADGSSRSDRFLVDSGADRTVFRAALVQRLRLPISPAPPGLALVGIGGASAFVSVAAVVEFRRDDGGLARVRGEFAALTDPAATDLSVLGRDVLDNFDLILSRRRNEILLLAPNHQYHVVQA
jgi:hypothetical protein